MNCKRCGQSLWRLRAGECPSCGEPFKPSQFRFVPKTVRFSCPYCEQGYLGAGSDGLIEPRRFECTFCGRWIDLDEMTLQPGEGFSEEDTRAEANPWLEMHRPLWVRWLLTSLRGIATPRCLMQLTPPETSRRSAAAFALLTLGVLAAGLLVATTGAGVCLSLPGAAGGFGAFSARGAGAWLAVVLGSALFGAAWPTVTHALLGRTGAVPHGPQRTAQAIHFTCAAHGLWFVPGAGVYIGWAGTLLWTVAAGRALAEAQSVPPRRALLCAAALPGVCALLLLGALGAGLLTGPTPLGTRAGGESVGAFAAPLHEALEARRPLRHGAELMADGRFPPSGFLAPGSRTTASDAEIAGITLADFEQASPARRLAIIQHAAHALPAGSPAHRLGDYVFLLDALPLVRTEPALWLIVEAWDPALNPAAARAVHALRADGSVRVIAAPARARALAEQNRLRAAHGLPPCPDPTTIRAGAPGTPGAG